MAVRRPTGRPQIGPAERMGGGREYRNGGSTPRYGDYQNDPRPPDTRPDKGGYGHIPGFGPGGHMAPPDGFGSWQEHGNARRDQQQQDMLDWAGRLRAEGNLPDGAILPGDPRLEAGGGPRGESIGGMVWRPTINNVKQPYYMAGNPYAANYLGIPWQSAYGNPEAAGGGWDSEAAQRSYASEGLGPLAGFGPVTRQPGDPFTPGRQSGGGQPPPGYSTSGAPAQTAQAAQAMAARRPQIGGAPNYGPKQQQLLQAMMAGMQPGSSQMVGGRNLFLNKNGALVDRTDPNNRFRLTNRGGDFLPQGSVQAGGGNVPGAPVGGGGQKQFAGPMQQMRQTLLGAFGPQAAQRPNLQRRAIGARY